MIKVAIIYLYIIPTQFLEPDRAPTLATAAKDGIGDPGILNPQQLYDTPLLPVIHIIEYTMVDRYGWTGGTFVVAAPVHIDGAGQHIRKNTVADMNILCIINAFVVFFAGKVNRHTTHVAKQTVLYHDAVSKGIFTSPETGIIV